MPQSSLIPSIERIVDAMIQLARAAKSHRMIVADSNRAEVFLELHRRGYSRVTTTSTCRVARDRYDVAFVAWREHSIKALETTLDWLVQLLGPASVLVVWVGPHERTPNKKLRLALGRLGFRIEAGTTCEKGVVVSARRIEASPLSQAA